MSNIFFLLVTLTVSFEVGRVAGISLTISPDRLRVTDDPQSVTFTCVADVALAGCQVRWLDLYNNPGPLLELSQGSQSRADPAYLTTELTGYSYSGRGLGAGDCGVSLQVKGYKRLMVACRVRAESGGWTYTWANLYAHSYTPLPHKLTTPREVVVLPGGEARFILEAVEPLIGCYFYLPSVSGPVVFKQGPASPHSTGRHRYTGAGPQSGHCGLALTSVSEADNGPVSCFIDTPTLKDDHRFLPLVVARPPTAPTLSLAYTGTHVTATCWVQASRPVAKISWVLGDDIIRQDENDDTQAGPQDEWRWPWMQASIQQTLTLQLQPQHNGKDLKCRVSHIALAQLLEAKSTVSFAEPTMSTTPVTTIITSPVTTSGNTTSATTSTDPMTTTSTTPGQKFISGNILDLLCQQTRLPATQLANTSCPNDEVYAFHVREAGAAARTAEVLEEVAKAEKSAKAAAAEITAKLAEDAARAHARAAEITSKIAEDAALVSLDAARARARAEEVTSNLAEDAARAHARAEEAKARAAEVASKLAEDAARARARAEQVTSNLAEDAARAHARAEEAWEKIAEEELQYERERRART